jgi:hypothetical protein
MVNMAKTVWGFDLSPGSETVDVDIRTAYSDGFLTSPKKFPIVFKARSITHQKVIEKEYETMKSFFALYKD